MKMKLLGAAALAAVINMGVAAAEAAENSHWACLASTATYKPMAGFNQIVGPTRFVGYFLPGPNLCRVTLFEAAADDQSLVVPPRRTTIDIEAAGRAEFPAGDGSALAIGCTAEADTIKIAPQRRLLSTGRS
jgi:hypothetical protein